MTPIVENLSENKRQVELMCENCLDIIRQEITLGEGKALLVYVETTATNVLMDQSVVARVLKQLSEADRERQGQLIRENGLGTAKSKQFTVLETALASMLTGDVLLFVDGCSVAVTLADKGYPGKPVGN